MSSEINSKVLKLLLSILIYSQSAVSWGEAPRTEYRLFGLEDGLTQGIISRIIQSRDGYLWLATWDGLVRYDGYTFKTFKARPGDGNTINNSRLYNMCEDSEENIWVNESSRAILFDTRTEKFVNVLSEAGIPDADKLNLRFIVPLRKNVVWTFYDDDRVFRIDLARSFQEGVVEQPMQRSKSWGKILQVYEDSLQNEWLITTKGVVDMQQNRLVARCSARTITQWRGHIWIGCGDGFIGYWNQTIGKFIPFASQKIGGEITSIIPYSEDMLVITTRGSGAYLYDYYTKNVTKIPLQSISDVFLSAYVDKRGKIWLEPEKEGVVRFDPQTGDVHPYFVHSAEKSNVFAIREDNEGHLWIIPKGRNLWVYDSESGTMKTLIEILDNSELNAMNVMLRGFSLDVHDNAWFNISKGLYKLSFPKYDYTLHDMKDAVEIRAMMIDSRKRLWVGSKDNHVRLYDSQHRLLGHLTAQGKISRSGEPFDDRIFSILETPDGCIWMASRANGLYYLIPEGSEGNGYRMVHYKNNPNNPYSLSGDKIFHLMSDSKNRVWIGTYGYGVNIVEKSKEGQLRFINQNNRLSGVFEEKCAYIRFVKEIKPGVFLFCTTSGLVLMNWHSSDVRNIKMKVYRRNPYNEKSLGSNDIMSVFKTGRGNVYVSTSGGGFAKVNFPIRGNTDSITFESFSQKKGLISDQVYSMIEDKEGALWAVSESALSRYIPSENRIETFSKSFFHRGFSFSEALPVYDGKGDLLFGTTQGIVEMNVEKIKKSQFVPRIAFTGFEIFNVEKQRIGQLDIDKLESITLSPEERSFAIEYAALDFSFSHNSIEYAYRLVGVDKEWNYVSSQRRPIFSNLPAGKYVFEVKSTNADGIWTDNVRQLRIVVEPTFAESVWGILTGLLLGGFIVWGGVYLYLKFYKLRHQVKIEEQITQLKLQFFTDISHELRTPLTLITSPLEEISSEESLSTKGKRNLQLVLRNTDRLLNLINQILDFRKVQNQKMTLSVEEQNIVPVIRQLMENFMSVAEENNIDFRLNTVREEIQLWIDRDKFEKIITNLLSNAFKFTPSDKSIVINISESETTVVIEIRDEGVGITANRMNKLFERFESFADSHSPSTGIGLSLVKYLCDLHYAPIVVNSRENEGSCFTIHFRKGAEHFAQDKHVFIQQAAVTVVSGNETAVNDVPADTSHGETSVLIVEDNIELRNFLCNVLSENYHIIEAENGRQGIESVRKAMPDLILTDIMMPVMDGIEMVKEIKMDNRICHIPIIVLSAKSSIENRIEGFEQGIDDYIPKPFSTNYLKVRIANILQKRDLLKQYYSAQLLAGPKDATFLSDESEIRDVLSALSPQPPVLQSYDEQFIDQLSRLMETRYSDPAFSIDGLVSELCLSRTVFYKKLKSLTGLSPVDFIRQYRIKRAIQFIIQSQLSVSEIAFRTGFKSQKYFSTIFKEETGFTPSEYKSAHMKED